MMVAKSIHCVVFWHFPVNNFAEEFDTFDGELVPMGDGLNDGIYCAPNHNPKTDEALTVLLGAIREL